MQSRTVLVRRGEFGVALLERTATAPQVLTGTGAAVWDSFDEPSTVPGVTARLATEYGVAPEVVACDVDRLVTDLLALGLLVEG